MKGNGRGLLYFCKAGVDGKRLPTWPPDEFFHLCFISTSKCHTSQSHASLQVSFKILAYIDHKS